MFFRYLTTPAKSMQLYQLMRAGSHFLIAILMTKIGLEASQIGQYEWMVWIGALLSSFWINALLQTIPFSHSDLAKEEQPRFILLTFLLFSGLGALVLLLFYTFQGSLLPLLTGQSNIPGLGLFLLYLCFHIGTYPVEIWYLIDQKGAGIFIWGIATFIVHVFALIIPISITGDLTSGLKAIAWLSGIRWIYAAIIAFRGASISKLKINLAFPWIKVSLRLILYALVGHLINVFDGWLVGHHFQDSSVFAIFRYGSREFPLSLAMATALGTSMLPSLSNGWQTDQISEALASMKAKTTKLMHILFPVSVLVVLCADWIFVHLFNEQFRAAAPLFCIYMLTTIPRVLLPTSILIAKGDTRMLFWIGIVELLLKVVLGLLFLYLGGLAGLAWSVVVCNLFEKSAVALYLRHQYHVSMPEWVDTRLFFAYSLLLAITVLLTVYG